MSYVPLALCDWRGSSFFMASWELWWEGEVLYRVSCGDDGGGREDEACEEIIIT